MATPMNYAMKKFDDKNSFSLWKVKLKLVQGGIQKVLKSRDKLPESLSKLEKYYIMEKTTSAIQLSLTD